MVGLQTERVFRRSWLCLARQEELSAKGDYIVRVIDVCGASIILTRGKDDRIPAFHDVSRHPRLWRRRMITLHYVATANGMKIAIALEEMGLDYAVIDYPLFEGRHLTPEFRRLNPNCKLPVLVDDAPASGGEPVTVFETGAILLYLAEKTGRFLPAAGPARWEAVQWLIWQVASHGPMNGQAHHFVRYAPEGQDYGVTRYRREVVRLLNVLEYRLNESRFAGGPDYTIADMAIWHWAWASPLLDIDMSEFPAVARWIDAVGQRPAVVRATTNPATALQEGNTQLRAKLSAEQWSNMFGENMHRAATLT